MGRHGVVGRIARAHGIRGQVIVNPETDFPDERFQPGAELFIERGGEVETLTADHGAVSPASGRSSASPASTTMNDAEALAGQELRVPVDGSAPLPAGHVLPARPDRLPGGHVRRASRSAPSATSKERSTGSRLVVDGADGEILIPLVAEICTDGRSRRRSGS